MKSSIKLKALAGTALLIASGSAFATTSLDPVGGSIYMNLWDQTTGATYVFDTGLNMTTFNGTSSVVNDSVSSDANYQNFIAQIGGSDTVTYNVVASGSGGVFTTGSAAPSTTPRNSGVATAAAGAGTQAGQVNGLSGSSTNSALATSSNNANAEWGAADGAWSSLNVTANDAVGTALNFYSLLFNGGAAQKNSNTRTALLTTFAHTWDFSNGVLTYNNTVQAVPVPAPLGLLLGGLALMGVIARRKSADTGVNAAAA